MERELLRSDLCCVLSCDCCVRLTKSRFSFNLQSSSPKSSTILAFFVAGIAGWTLPNATIGTPRRERLPTKQHWYSLLLEGEWIGTQVNTPRDFAMFTNHRARSSEFDAKSHPTYGFGRRGRDRDRSPALEHLFSSRTLRDLRRRDGRDSRRSGRSGSRRRNRCISSNCSWIRSRSHSPRSQAVAACSEKNRTYQHSRSENHKDSHLPYGDDAQYGTEDAQQNMDHMTDVGEAQRSKNTTQEEEIDTISEEQDVVDESDDRLSADKGKTDSEWRLVTDSEDDRNVEIKKYMKCWKCKKFGHCKSLCPQKQKLKHVNQVEDVQAVQKKKSSRSSYKNYLRRERRRRRKAKKMTKG